MPSRKTTTARTKKADRKKVGQTQAARKSTQNPTRQYELTYLLPVLASAELEPPRDQVAKLVAKHSGTITQTEDWGKRQLAYTIHSSDQPHTQAVFTHLRLDLPPDKVKTLDKDLTLQPQVIRHLIVTSVDVPSTMVVDGETAQQDKATDATVDVR